MLASHRRVESSPFWLSSIAAVETETGQDRSLAADAAVAKAALKDTQCSRASRSRWRRESHRLAGSEHYCVTGYSSPAARLS